MILKFILLKYFNIILMVFDNFLYEYQLMKNEPFQIQTVSSSCAIRVQYCARIRDAGSVK